MSLQKNIGKNTIGDNNKMSVNLHTYNMSTHDLSTIFRNAQSAGTLVPNLELLHFGLMLLYYMHILVSLSMLVDNLGLFI